MTHEELCRMEQSQLIKLIDEGKLAQVVRCKDCKYRNKPYNDLWCYYVDVADMDFCNCGEKKERENNGK